MKSCFKVFQLVRQESEKFEYLGSFVLIETSGYLSYQEFKSRDEAASAVKEYGYWGNLYVVVEVMERA